MATVTSTINKTGEDYASLTAWEAAKNGDLVTATTIQVAECYDDDGALDDAFTIDGSTTSTDYYMKVTTPVDSNRHTGKLSDGSAGNGFRITKSWGSSPPPGVVDNQDDYTVIEWIQVSLTQAGYGGTCINNAAHATIRNNIIYSSGASYQSSGISIDANGKTINVLNNIIFAASAANEANGLYISRGTMYAYNNTVNNFGIGIYLYNYAVSAYLKNNLLTNNSTDYAVSGGGLTASATNITSDNTSPDGASYQSKTITYTDAANGDFHTSDADVVDVGTDLGTTPAGVQYDIDNYDRDTGGGTWDIGADEYVASGTTKSVSPITATLAAIAMIQKIAKIVSPLTVAFTLPTGFQAKINEIITPNVQSLALSVIVPRVVISCTKTVAPLTVTFDQPTPTFGLIVNKTVSISVFTMSLSQQAPLVKVSCTKTVAPVTVSFMLQAPSVSGSMSTTVSIANALALSMAVQSAQKSIIYVATSRSLSIAIVNPTPAAQFNTTVGVSVLFMTFSVEQASAYEKIRSSYNRRRVLIDNNFNAERYVRDNRIEKHNITVNQDIG